MTVYLAIDPGVGTGIAWWDPFENDWWSHETDDLQEVARCVRDVYDPRNTLLITEKFIISQRTIRGKVYYESLYFNGWLSIEYPDRIEQTAAQAKGLITDDVLKHFGWFTRTKDGHANDASRHLLYRALKNREPYAVTKMAEYARTLGHDYETEQDQT